MKIHPKLICYFLPLVFLSGCKKSSSAPETSTTKPAANTNTAPATTAPAAPAAAPGGADAAASAETAAKLSAA